MIAGSTESVKKSVPLRSRRAPFILRSWPPLAALLLLIALPARAQGTKQYLCDITGTTDCPDYGRPRGGEPPPRDPVERGCPSCDAADAALAAANFANMTHPVPAIDVEGETLAIVFEDAAAANAAMEALEALVAAVLAAPLLEIALNVALALVALNVVADIAHVQLPAMLRIPLWLNALSLTRAGSPSAAKSCADLEADAQAACKDLSSAMCSPDDDCETLLAKRKARLPCELAWAPLSRRSDCATPRADFETRTRNRREVGDCGRFISNDPRCCPQDLSARRRACKEKQGACNDELDLDDDDLLRMSEKRRMDLCASVQEKRKANDDCYSVRAEERDICYKGDLDSGHVEALESALFHSFACATFLQNLRRFILCP